MRIVYSLLTLILLFSSLSINAKEKITITTSNWPPYVSKTAPKFGYISQIIIEAFYHENIDVEFLFMPWSRAYEEAKHGNVDATSYWYKDDMHTEDFYLSQAISTEKVVFFRLKSEKPLIWKSLTDFNGLRMGLTRSYTYTSALWEYAEKNNERVSIVSTDKQNLKMLLLDRIDITPAQEIVGWHILQNIFAKEQINRVEVMYPPLSVKTGHLLFPKAKKDSKRLMQHFNRGLAKLALTGRLDELQEDLILGEFSR
ncbi:substrate-binding periplasmic protein [Thalassotalea ganghwensis]